MKLLNIKLNGYGKLVNQEFRFAPGLNLIFGPNEAGKSTLQHAILSALYGFFDDGSIPAAKRAVQAAFEPWDASAEYSLTMTFILENGVKYEVRRIFAPRTESHIIEMENAKDISTTFRSASQGRLFFADELLGMPKSVFENTCFVRQAELVALDENASAITDALLRLSASASQESTATQAGALLESTLANQIGTVRAWTKPLAQAREKLAKLEKAREQAVQDHQHLNLQISELNQSQENFTRLEYEVNRTRYIQLLAEKDTLLKQRTAVDNAAKEVEQRKQQLVELEKWADFPDDIYNTFNTLNTQRSQLVAESRKDHEHVLRTLDTLPSLSRQLSDLILQASQVSGEQGPTLDAIPKIDSSLDIETAKLVRHWLDQFVQLADQATHAAQVKVDQDQISLASLIALRQQGLAAYKERLRACEAQIRQKQDDVEKLHKKWTAEDYPKEKWDQILEAKLNNVKEWEVWASFPIESREDVKLLDRQRVDLREQLSKLEIQSVGIQKTLNELKTQISAQQKLPSQSKELIIAITDKQNNELQELNEQVRIFKDTLRRAKERQTTVETALQTAEQAIEVERKQLEPLIAIGQPGLLELQNRFLLAQQRVSQASERAQVAQAEWSRLGMPISHFQELEQTVKSIQSGQSPMPKPRKGCKSVLSFQKTDAIPDQTPTEIILYTQGQPIYAELVRSQTEAESAKSALQVVEVEIAQQLEGMIHTSIQAESFAVLGDLLQQYQGHTLRLENQRTAMVEAQNESGHADEQFQQARANLHTKLVELGFSDPDVSIAWQAYLQADKRSQQYAQEEANLERLQMQVHSLEADLKVWQDKQSSLEKVENELLRRLQEAGIECSVENLDSALQQYQIGLENHARWLMEKHEFEATSSHIYALRDQLEQAHEEISKAQADLDGLKAEIARTLGDISNSDVDEFLLTDLGKRLEKYQADERVLQITQDKVERLKLQAKGIVQEISVWQDRLRELQRLNDQIALILHQVGINSDPMNFESGIQQFLEVSNGHTAWLQSKKEFDAATRHYETIQGSLSQAEADLEALKIKITDLKKKYPAFKSLTVQNTTQAYGKNVQKLESELLLERDNVNRLKDAVERSSKALPHLADLDEDIAMARLEVKRFEFFQRVLELAQSELDISTREFQKQFAPHLEREINSGLKSITNGRYADVRVDPNSLEIKVNAPERNDFVPVDHLSTGTRDLIYLILRIGLTRLMNNAGEKLPLLLDDPLVQFDRNRQMKAMEYIHQLAEENQIFIFTKDEVILDWYKESCSSVTQHQLHSLKTD